MAARHAALTVTAAAAAAATGIRLWAGAVSDAAAALPWGRPQWRRAKQIVLDVHPSPHLSAVSIWISSSQQRDVMFATLEVMDVLAIDTTAILVDCQQATEIALEPQWR